MPWWAHQTATFANAHKLVEDCTSAIRAGKLFVITRLAKLAVSMATSNTTTSDTGAGTCPCDAE